MNLRRYYVQANSDGDALFITCRGCEELLTTISDGDNLDDLVNDTGVHDWCEAPIPQED